MSDNQLHPFRSNTCAIFLYRMFQKMHFWTYFTHITVARTQYVGTICYHSINRGQSPLSQGNDVLYL